MIHKFGSILAKNRNSVQFTLYRALKFATFSCFNAGASTGSYWTSHLSHFLSVKTLISSVKVRVKLRASINCQFEVPR